MGNHMFSLNAPEIMVSVLGYLTGGNRWQLQGHMPSAFAHLHTSERLFAPGSFQVAAPGACGCRMMFMEFPGPQQTNNGPGISALLPFPNQSDFCRCQAAASNLPVQAMMMGQNAIGAWDQTFIWGTYNGSVSCHARSPAHT
jgi:hypothetical protein